VSQIKYLGITVTNRNLIQEEIKKKLNSGNAWYHSVQNLLSSRLLSKNLKIRIYKTIILPAVLYGYETSGPKRDEVTGEWRKLHNEELRDVYSSPSIIRIIKPKGMRWRWGRRGTRIGYWWEIQRERDH
jgi:hypothetical protein